MRAPRHQHATSTLRPVRKRMHITQSQRSRKRHCGSTATSGTLAAGMNTVGLEERPHRNCVP